MKELLERMIAGLRKQVEEKVPDKGTFPVVYEREDVLHMEIGLSHLILKVTALKYSEDERFLEIAAVNYPNPYGAEIAVGFGYTQDILSRLDEDGLANELAKKVPKLAEEIRSES